MIVLDRLPLAAGLALHVVDDGAGPPRAVPWVVDEDRRARPGDRAAEALVRLLAGGSRETGRFRITSWHAAPATGERSFGVDQTNESVVVGEQAVVKWMRTAEIGPHPAPAMLEALRRGGFAGMPQPWGLVEWRAPQDREPRLLVVVDALLPGAQDGWTWVVDDLRAATCTDAADVVEASGRGLGTLVADMHAALATTARPATPDDVAEWHTGALADLDAALAATTGAAHGLLVGRSAPLRDRLLPPAGVVGTPLVLVHGDLHVGQVLRAGSTLAVTDFDGNPVIPPGQRVRPQPAALDVAGMTQSIIHAAYVLRRHEPHRPSAVVRRMADAFVAAFVASYVDRLDRLGQRDLFEPALVPSFRLRQVCREFTYAALHLPRWSYVPEAALVDLVPTEEGV